MRSNVDFLDSKFSKVSFLFFSLLYGFCFSQLVHPGISHKLSDLERMKHMVEAGVAPWSTTYNLLKSERNASYDYDVAGDATNTTITSHSQFMADGYAAYHNALMWYITGDERHAQKCIEIFNAWVNIRRIEDQFALNNGRGPWKMCEAAEIIKHTYNGWSESDINKFKEMLVYPGWSGTTAPSAAMSSKDVSFYWNIYQGDPARHGNQGLFGYRSLMAMAIFLDNEIMYDRALRYLQGLSHRSDDLPYPSGPPVTTPLTSGNEYYEEFRQVSRSNTVEDYGYNEVMSNYIYENGQCQESSRDQTHSIVGIAIINCISEMAWNQGDDLYGHLENRQLLGLEYSIRYNLSEHYSYPDQLTPWEPTVESGEFIERTDRSGRWKSLKINPYVAANLEPENYERGTNLVRSVYEIMLGHYKDRMGLPSDAYKWVKRGFDLMQDSIGVENGSNAVDYHGYGGLKFRRVSPGDPISGFEADGLPIYKMNKLPIIIEAENYDYFVLDGQNITYKDISSGNEGGAYRTDESVDIKVCSEGGYNVTNIENGEWLTYTLNVPSNGIYDVLIRYASVNSNGSVKLNFDGKDITPEITVPFGASNSTGLTDWKDLKVGSEIRLSKGVQAMKIEFSGQSGSFDLNNIVVSLVAADPDPVNLAPIHGAASHSVDSDPCPYGGCAELAIDQNTNGNFGGGSVSHSAHGTSGSLKWWQVDLGDNYNIEAIDIYNRTGYESRLSDITVDIIDTEGTVTFTKFYEGYPNPVLSIPLGTGVPGSVVKISKTSDLGITLAEVEVYGVDSPVTLSDNTVELENKLKLFPNSINNEFTISDCKGGVLFIYNMLGEQVFSSRVENNNQLIVVDHLKSGVYFVKISDIGTTLTKKIIKN